MNIRNKLILVILFLSIIGSGFARERPNIIMATCHNIGHHLGCYGIKEVSTPNIDKLAEKGLMFRNSYSTSAVCSPGRASLLTRRYPQSNGVMGLIHEPWSWSLNDDEKHIAQILSENGYDTYLVGLNHISDDLKRLGYKYNPPSKGDGEAGVKNAAIQVIKKLKNSENRVFMKVGNNLVHRLYTQGTDSTKGIFVPPYLANIKKMREDLAQFQGEIAYLDKFFGEIIEAVANSEEADNNLILFTSDHGIPYPGAKWNARAAGLQVPTIIYMSKTTFTGGKDITDIFSNVDVLPTLLSFIGIQIPINIEGKNFMPFLNGKTPSGPRKYAYGQYTTDMKRDNLSRCIITEEYQLIRYFGQGRSLIFPIDVDPNLFAAHRERARYSGTRPYAEFYNLKNDPFELNNITGDENFNNLKKELSSELMKWMIAVDDQILKGSQRTPYYD
jgi:arylsulfatase A-like enzyme